MGSSYVPFLILVGSVRWAPIVYMVCIIGMHWGPD